jgi:hypothetical protein
MKELLSKVTTFINGEGGQYILCAGLGALIGVANSHAAGILVIGSVAIILHRLYKHLNNKD